MALRDLVPLRRKEMPVRREESPFDLLRREMDSLFDNFARAFDIEPFKEGTLGSFSPNVDVTESEEVITVSAELPGMDDKDIDVSLGRDSLAIRGEKKLEKEEKGKGYYRMERFFGSFSRTVPLHVEVDTDKAEATFKKGVLKVKLPKTAKAREEKKKISVQVE